MKAVVKTAKGPGNVAYIDFPTPEKPGPGELLIEVKATGICGTDLHILHDTFRNRPPVVLGHEFAGVVLETGAGVTRFKPGDRVTAEAPARICGKCRYCRTGNYNHCVDRLGMGWGVDGSFAKYTVTEELMTHKVPDNVSFKAGALIEPMACVAHCMELSEVQAHDVVVISGPGPIGLLMTQAVKAEGAVAVVIGTDVDRKRLEAAKAMGADHIVNAQQTDALQFVRDLTEGYGADVVIECAGAAPSVAACMDYVRRMGKYTQMALFGGKQVPVDMDKLVVKEFKTIGVQSQRWTAWDNALRLLARGVVDLEPLVTHEFGLDEWEKAFEVFENKSGLKVVMYPNE